MNISTRPILCIIGAMALILIVTPAAASATDVALMTKEELQSRLETGAVAILDVRAGRDWNSSEFKIKGAQRVDGKDVAAWADNYTRGETIVLYCA